MARAASLVVRAGPGAGAGGVGAPAIRYALHGPPPRSVRGDVVHAIVSRGTLYGVHRPLLRPDLDAACSKTTLLLFADAARARLFATRYLQKNPALRRPWQLESMPFRDIERVCLLNYLDMYLCFHVAAAGAGGAAEAEGPRLDCYEHLSAEYPNRQMLTTMMENMWRRGD